MHSPGQGKQAANDGSAKLIESESDITPLSGTWEFYWQHFLTKNDLSNSTQTYVLSKVPGLWNNLVIDGKNLPGFGYGTYRLHLSGLQAGKQIALYIPVLAVSYELYADHQFLAGNGRVSKSSEGFVPGFLPRTAYFTAQGSEVDLIVHVSNYTYARTGIWHPIYLGSQTQVEQMERMILYKDVFMLGAYITLALYYVSLYVLRREKQSLLFVLMCIGAVMRTMVNGDRAIVRLFTAFPFDLLIKFDYIAMLLFYPIMMLLITQRFEKESRRIVTYGFIGFGVLASCIVLLTPVEFFTQYVLVNEVFLFVSISYTLVILGIASLRFRKNALYMFFAMLILLFLTLRDLLYQSGIADNPLGEISAFGFFLFLLLESFAISRDYADNFRKVQNLSQQLIENDKLKDKVRQTEMAFLQSQIKPHFLYNSLSVIDEYCEINPKEASRLIGSLAKYLRQSFNFENLESSVSIQKELDLVRYYVDIESARFEDLKVEYHTEYENDFSLPPLTIQPLVENAVRHGARKKSGEGRVVLRILQTEENVEISVSDNGAGIPSEKLKALLSDKTKSVGLLNIHNRLLRMYGQGLTIISSYGEGTTVCFRIPVRRP
jgi:sensor histidine kinase YesM